MMVITPQQLQDGYRELVGRMVFVREFVVIRRLPDGNYLVVDPRKK